MHYYYLAVKQLIKEYQMLNFLAGVFVGSVAVGSICVALTYLDVIL